MKKIAVIGARSNLVLLLYLPFKRLSGLMCEWRHLFGRRTVCRRGFPITAMSAITRDHGDLSSERFPDQPRVQSRL